MRRRIPWSFTCWKEERTGKGSRIARIVPEELQEGITRLRIQVEMKDETHLQVELEDLGFGSFRTATHHIWKEEIEL